MRSLTSTVFDLFNTIRARKYVEGSVHLGLESDAASVDEEFPRLPRVPRRGTCDVGALVDTVRFSFSNTSFFVLKKSNEILRQ